MASHMSSMFCRGEWEVLDFGDAVVHVFTAEQRGYYDLESFYGAAEEVCPAAGSAIGVWRCTAVRRSRMSKLRDS